MFNLKTILFPVDFSTRSHAAAPFVLSMAQRYQARIVLLHAFEPPPPGYGGMTAPYPEIYDIERIRKDMRPRLEEFAKLELPKVEAACIVETGNAAAVITEYAETNRVDLIAMPTHGYGPLRRALLGSVTAKVLHDSKIAIWTDAHTPEPSHRAHPKPRLILAAIDLKPESEHTLESALQLARDAEARIEVVYVAREDETNPAQAERRISELVSRIEHEQPAAVEQLDEANADIVVDGGSIAGFIRRAALRKRSDLIVIGRGAIQGVWSRLRANSYAIVREAPCPVISV